ncbi:MlaA family lipoprotein [Pseudomarimonas salicorniae]|uniref:VacJ family lipoprotein n=1 Tax=Pseudomarimonas salicorniae TaxID=2933270 RepID=A0ABT0GE87_9GAMM|nr:VacJ family lipoprotein [Lysobacter sp. CAU 1642]MCK7592320.1 VacJ family lipoprotein [Lysobacter sp. CAU 1642]
MTKLSPARFPRLSPLLLCLVLLGAGPAFAQTPQPVVPAAEEDPFLVAEMQDDAQALSSFEALDPWQGFNRPVYRFNRGFDRIIFRPIAKVYDKVTPKLVKTGVNNFFDNLQEPVVTVNLLLQGRPKAALQSFGRFLMNSTLGLAGVLDPASHARFPRHRGDFGQTFGRWGWKKSRYIVLPIFGPATVRDGLGKGVNTRVSPIDWLAREEGAEYTLLYGIDARARALSAEALLEGAADEYLLVRDAYLQNRRCQIIDCSDDLPDYLLPDYEFEVPDFDALESNLRR